MRFLEGNKKYWRRKPALHGTVDMLRLHPTPEHSVCGWTNRSVIAEITFNNCNQYNLKCLVFIVLQGILSVSCEKALKGSRMWEPRDLKTIQAMNVTLKKKDQCRFQRVYFRQVNFQKEKIAIHKIIFTFLTFLLTSWTCFDHVLNRNRNKSIIFH